jgi:hypothetical protein
VHETLKALDASLTEAKGVALGLPDALSIVQRVSSVTGFAQNRLQQADATLVSLSLLNSMNQSGTAANGEVRNFITNKNAAHLDNASNQADAIVQSSSAVPVLSTRADARGLVADIGNLRATSAEALAHWQADAAQLTQHYAEARRASDALRSEIDAQKGVLTQAITQYQTTFSQSEESRQAQFITAQQSRAEEAEKNVSSRKQQFEDQVDKQREAFDVLRQELVTTSTEFFEESKDTATQNLAVIDGLRGKAEGLLGVIGTTGVVSGYKRVADQEQLTARTWAIIAALAFVGLIVMACVAFLPSLEGEFSWGAFAGRIYVSLTFGLLAAFAAYQSEQHFSVERRARRLEIELASLGPFIAEFTQPEQTELKRALVERIFGQQEAPTHLNGSDRVTTGTVKDLVELGVRLAGRK